jgi:hypothetical protein
VGVELFYFEGGPVGLREEKYAAVGHRAVDVHEEELDLGGALFYGGGDFGSWGQDGLQ